MICRKVKLQHQLQMKANVLRKAEEKAQCDRTFEASFQCGKHIFRSTSNRDTNKEIWEIQAVLTAQDVHRGFPTWLGLNLQRVLVRRGRGGSLLDP